MKTVLLYLVFIASQILLVKTACTFSSSLQGSWTSSNYGTITIDSSTLTLVLTISGGTTNRIFNCEVSSGSTYVVVSQQTFTALGKTGNAVMCLEFNMVNSNSYYFYMNSPTLNVFNNERISFWETTPTQSQACTENPSVAEFNSMVKFGSEESAVTNCMAPLLGNFNYERTTTAGTRDCANDNMTVCTTRQEINFDVVTCTSPASMFSLGKRLGCTTGGIYDSSIDGGTYYEGLYNFDATINGLTTFQFVCIAVTDSGTTRQVSATPKRCTASQKSSATPATTGGQQFTLTPYVTCPIEDDSVNVLPIVLGVIFGLIFLLLLALLIYCCCKKKKKRDKIKAKIQRNLKLFEKKMAMDEFDDEHPLNETSLVPDFPQNGYPEPLKISPRGKKYSMPQVADVEIQTDRSYTPSRDFDLNSSRGLGGPPKTFHGSNKSLATHTTQKDFEGPADSVSEHRSAVITKNKTLENKLQLQNKQPVEFPSKPQFLPWPWRTANRAMRSHPASVKSGAPSIKSFINSLPDLGEYTIKTYGIKYDDTLTSVVTHPPPRRPLSRANSVFDLSRPQTRMLEIKKSVSHEHLNRPKTSFGHYPQYPTNKPRLNRSVSHNDVSHGRHNKQNLYHQAPRSLPNAPSRRASVATIKTMLQRSNTRMLKTIRESKERIPTPLKTKRKHPLPHYMRPLTRAKTTVPSIALKKAANVYGRPKTGKFKERAKSMLQIRLKQQHIEEPVRKKKKKLRKRRSSWKSPFSLPSSIQSRPLSLKTLSKVVSSKVEPARSTKTSARLNDSLTSRDFITTDQEITSDSTGENFLDAETLRHPVIQQKPQINGQPVREKTYGIDKKVSEDSGISADESAMSSDDTRFPLPDITDTNMPTTKPGVIKPPPRRKPWL